MSSEFAKKKGFKLKKIERPIYVRNINGTFNEKRPIEYTVKVNIYHQEYREKTEINVIRGQKQNLILEMLWLACHNPEINWKTGQVKMTRCPDECGKQQRPNQEKSSQQKQKEEEVKEVQGKKKDKEEKKQEKGKMIEIKKVAEKQEIWDNEKEVARSEKEAKKLIPE